MDMSLDLICITWIPVLLRQRIYMQSRRTDVWHNSDFIYGKWALVFVVFVIIDTRWVRYTNHVGYVSIFMYYPTSSFILYDSLSVLNLLSVIIGLYERCPVSWRRTNNCDKSSHRHSSSGYLVWIVSVITVLAGLRRHRLYQAGSNKSRMLYSKLMRIYQPSVNIGSNDLEDWGFSIYAHIYCSCDLSPHGLKCQNFRRMSVITLIARCMGPTWGRPGADRTQAEPMLTPRTLYRHGHFKKRSYNLRCGI